jgi:hypothetical protein
MDIFTNLTSMAAIIAICELIDLVYKTKTSADNKWIPIISMVSGAVLAVLAWFFYPSIYSAADIFTAIAMGIGSGATAVAGYEAFFNKKSA